MTTDADTTGDALRAEREEARLTQHELAARMRTTQQHVSTIEGRAKVRASTAQRYLEAVHVHTQAADEAVA